VQKTPLNVKVFNDIYKKIQSKQYAAGDLLPTEQEMESIYGASRAPIRQALGKLEQEGLIVRRPGKGTFVAKDEVTGPWITMGGFSQEFGLKLNQLKCKTLTVKNVPADREVSQFLALLPGKQVLHTSRLRYLNGNPLYYLKHYTTCLDIETVKAAGDFPSMRTILMRSGVDVTFVSEEISAIKAKATVAEKLNVAEGHPVMQIFRISYTADNKPIEYTRYYVLSDDWKYRVAYSKNSIQSFEEW
jgi:DNA-binding GntR family transcriptional regulator